MTGWRLPPGFRFGRWFSPKSAHKKTGRFGGCVRLKWPERLEVKTQRVGEMSEGLESLVVLVQFLEFFALTTERRNGGSHRHDKHDADKDGKQC
jgi:hypothetical protein